MKWLMTDKKSISGIRASIDPRDLRNNKIKKVVAYILYFSLIPLNVLGMVIITTNLEMRTANEIMIEVAVSYAYDFLLVQTLLAAMRAVATIHLFKKPLTDVPKWKRNLLLKLIGDQLLRKIK